MVKFRFSMLSYLLFFSPLIFSVIALLIGFPVVAAIACVFFGLIMFVPYVIEVFMKTNQNNKDNN